MDYSHLSDYELYTGLVKSADKMIDTHLDTLSWLYILKNSTFKEINIPRDVLENNIKFYEDELKRTIESKEICEKEIQKYFSKI